MGGFEATVAQAGELVSQAKDLADDAEVEQEELDVLNYGTETTNKAKRERQQAKEKGLAVAKAIGNAYSKGREAKGKVAGAAAAAKKFGVVKGKIKEAEDSFKEARKKLKRQEQKLQTPPIPFKKL